MVPTWGKVEFLGSQFYPQCMRMTFVDGRSLDMSLRGVRPYLQGQHTTPPQAVTDVLFATPVQVSTVQLLTPVMPVQHVDAALHHYHLMALGSVLDLSCFQSCYTMMDPPILGDFMPAECKVLSFQALFGNSLAVDEIRSPAAVVCCANDLVDALPLVQLPVNCVSVMLPYTALTCSPVECLHALSRLVAANQAQVVRVVVPHLPMLVLLCMFQNAQVRSSLLMPAHLGSCRSIVLL